MAEISDDLLTEGNDDSVIVSSVFSHTCALKQY